MKYPPVVYILFDLITHRYIGDYLTLEDAIEACRNRGNCYIVEQKNKNGIIALAKI